MSSGPAASPSSQIVTRRTEEDLERVGDPERSRPMETARGTTEMQVNVLGGVSLFLSDLWVWVRG